jgi:pyruvate dehydrogenase E2 component (dihydrolipoamide acetyltransferase)
MIKGVKLAKINLTMQSGRIVRWLKKEGDRIERDEPLLEVETDKAVNTVESFHSGYLKKILVAEGQEVPVDTLIAYVGDPEDEIPAGPLPRGPMAEAGAALGDGAKPGGAGEPDGAAVAAAGRAGSGGEAGASGPRGAKGINASPLARRLAAEMGVDLAAVTGSGPEGRIGKEDVLAAAQRGAAGATAGSGGDLAGGSAAAGLASSAGAGGAPGPSAEVRFVPLTGVKKATAERMKASYLEAPHIHLDVAVNVGALEALRTRLNAGESATPSAGESATPSAGGRSAASSPARYTLTDLLVRAVSLALEANPVLNGAFRDGAIAIIGEHGIGVAVSSPGGLVVPVIRGCQRLSLRQIRDRRRELVGRAREGRQTAEDLSGGTFTITNLGMFGVDSFRPILFPGQAAILAAGAIRRVAIPDAAGGFSAQPVMQLTLGCDHRVVDGAEAAAFLRRLKELLESPAELTSGTEPASSAEPM